MDVVYNPHHLPKQHTKEDIKAVEKILGVTFTDKKLLSQALKYKSIHANVDEKSFPFSNSIPCNAKWLEFLGDKILGFIVAEYLYHNGVFTIYGEVVSNQYLGKIAEEMKILPYVIFLNHHEQVSATKADKTRRHSLACVFEAIIGAIYIDQGIRATKNFLEKILDNQVKRSLNEKGGKDAIQTYEKLSMRNYGVKPQYKYIGKARYGRDTIYEYRTYINGRRFGTGYGTSKLKAQKNSAKEALEEHFNIETP